MPPIQARSTWFFTLLVMVACSVISGCARTPPEQKLRESMASMQASLEARDASGMETWLAEDFVGPDGLDRKGARRLAQMMFLRHGAIGASLGPKTVAIQNGHASVRFTVAMTGSAGGVLPDAANLYDVETAWRMEQGEWRLISAQWKPRL